MTAEVARLQAAGCISEWTGRRPPMMITPIFAVQQRDKWRMVANWRSLNLRQEPPPTFRMEGWREVAQLIGTGDLLAKADLTAAYHLLRLHPSCHTYAGFRWNGRTYFWKVMPFGWAWAPFVFTKVLTPAMRSLRMEGLRSVTYLDDILLILPSDRQAAAAQVRLFLDRMKTLNLPLKLSKCVLDPTDRIEFLGVQIDNSGQETVLLVPEGKRRDAAASAKRLLAQKRIPVRRLAQFVGFEIGRAHV